MKTKHLYTAILIFGSSFTFAQDATKETTVQAAEMLQNARTDAPQNGTKQEPVKQEPAKKEDKKEKPAPAAAPAAPADDQSDSKPGSTQKMAITEQGIKNKKKSSAAATTTIPATPATPPAAEEPKK